MVEIVLGAIGWQAGAGVLPCTIGHRQLCNNAQVLYNYKFAKVLFTIAQMQFYTNLAQVQLFHIAQMHHCNYAILSNFTFCTVVIL